MKFGSNIFLLVIIFSICFIFVPLTYYFHFSDYPISKDPSIWGSFGDYIGGILNPIFTFLTFILLLINLHVQNLINVNNDRRHEKEELERSISYISPILSEIHNRIKKKINVHPAKNAPFVSTNLRRGGSQPIFWDIVDDLVLLHKFLMRIKELQSESPFLEYYIFQYRETINIFYTKGYLNDEIKEFFKD